MKALIIREPYGSDLGHVLQIARAEAMKIFHDPHKIKVLDMIQKNYGWIVVVQNGESSISENMKKI